jgi:hypothetical protein
MLRNSSPTAIVYLFAIGFAAITGACSFDKQTASRGELTQTFIAPGYGVRFDYPSNWIKQIPERKATVILLFENSGAQATCNLSVVAQDMETVEQYNADYFNRELPKFFTSVQNIRTRLETIRGKKVSWTTYDFIIRSGDQQVNGKSITLTTLHKGRRFMLIINTPLKNEYLKNDIDVITQSIQFE